MTLLTLACERGRSIQIDPRKTALACIDFQADFINVDGMNASRGLAVEYLAQALVPARRVLDAARAAGVFVFHTREAYAADLSDLNLFRRQYDTIIGQPGPLGRFLIRGENGTRIVETMQPINGEPVIDKAAFSAFHQTTLDTILRVRGIETLLLMGITAQCCVASTLRSAVDHGYSCVLLEDATAAFELADVEATVRIIFSENDNFGWVSDSERVLRCLADAPATSSGQA
jgi:nicotinamidase-related amidase